MNHEADAAALLLWSCSGGYETGDSPRGSASTISQGPNLSPLVDSLLPASDE